MQMAINKNWFIYPRDKKRSRKAQSILEYAILIGVVTAALISMSLYVRRAIQANLKTIEHQINLESINATN